MGALSVVVGIGIAAALTLTQSNSDPIQLLSKAASCHQWLGTVYALGIVVEVIWDGWP